MAGNDAGDTLIGLGLFAGVIAAGIILYNSLNKGGGTDGTGGTGANKPKGSKYWAAHMDARHFVAPYRDPNGNTDAIWWLVVWEDIRDIYVNREDAERAFNIYADGGTIVG